VLISPDGRHRVTFEVEDQLRIREVAVRDENPWRTASPVRRGEGVIESRVVDNPTLAAERFEPLRRSVIIHHENRVNDGEMLNGVSHQRPRRVDTFGRGEFEARLSRLR